MSSNEWRDGETEYLERRLSKVAEGGPGPSPTVAMYNHVTHKEAHEALALIMRHEHTLHVPPQDSDADMVISRYIRERFRADCPFDNCEGTPYRCGRCEAETAGIRA